MSKYWGTHLTLNMSNCSLYHISNKDNIIAFIEDLCRITDMTRVGDVIFYEVEQTEENDRDDLTGLTAFQMIKTSNITIHFCNPTKSLYLDFFSCKDYDYLEVIELTKIYFKSFDYDYKVLCRDVNKPFVILP